MLRPAASAPTIHKVGHHGRSRSDLASPGMPGGGEEERARRHQPGQDHVHGHPRGDREFQLDADHHGRLPPLDPGGGYGPDGQVHHGREGVGGHAKHQDHAPVERDAPPARLRARDGRRGRLRDRREPHHPGRAGRRRGRHARQAALRGDARPRGERRAPRAQRQGVHRRDQQAGRLLLADVVRRQDLDQPPLHGVRQDPAREPGARHLPVPRLGHGRHDRRGLDPSLPPDDPQIAPSHPKGAP